MQGKKIAEHAVASVHNVFSISSWEFNCHFTLSGFDPENSEGSAPDISLPANFTINLTGLGGEPGELGSKLDSQAVLTDYSTKHRRTLTFQDALQLSAVLSQSQNTRASMSQSDWDRVVSADKDAPAWLQLSSKRECAVHVSNLPLSVTAEKLEGQLDSEAECNVMEVYLLKVRNTVHFPGFYLALISIPANFTRLTTVLCFVRSVVGSGCRE